MQVSAAASQAFALIEEGKDLEADDLMVRETQKALKKYGPQSTQYISRLREHAQVLLQVGNYVEGLQFLQDARKVRIATPDGQRLYADINHDLGSAHMTHLEFRDAAQAYEESWKTMVQLLGDNHPDSAAYLISLSEAKLGCGLLSETIELADRAFSILSATRDELAWVAYAVSGAARNALGQPVQRMGLAASFLSGEEIEIVVALIVDKLGYFDAQHQAAVLNRVYLDLKDLPAATLSSLISVSEQLAFQLDRSEQFATAEWYWDACVQHGRAANDDETMISCLMEKAKTIARNGDFDRAERTIFEALEIARNSSIAEMLPYAMRGYARILAHDGKLTRAEEMLQMSVENTKRIGNHAAIAPSLTDLGVFLHHSGRYEEATTILNEALDHHVEHDEVFERTVQHLKTAKETLMCGCFGDVDAKEICDRIADEVDPEFIFNELIAGLNFDKYGGVSIQLSRAPNKAEEELMDEYCLRCLNGLEEARQEANIRRLHASGLR